MVLREGESECAEDCRAWSSSIPDRVSRTEMGTSIVISGCLWKKRTDQTRASVSLYGGLWYNLIKNFMVEIDACYSCCLKYNKKTAWKYWKLHLNIRKLFTVRVIEH